MMANWYDRQSKANLAAHILSQEVEIARLTAALAEAEARADDLRAENERLRQEIRNVQKVREHEHQRAEKALAKVAALQPKEGK